MSRVTLLGIPVDALSAGEVCEQLRDYLRSAGQHHVMTPNSEMLVAASKDPSFRALLNRTDLNIPDSAGLLWAARYTGQHLPERVTGVDTVQALCRELSEEHPVFFLGAGDGVADSAAAVLRARNPHLKIAGAYAGSPWPEDAADSIRRINESRAHVLLVAYGAPAQDKWIDEHLKQMPAVRLAMGVGGTFDFIAGIQKRAPQWMRNMHLEWLWRVVREPKRLPRIIRATVVFPFMILLNGRRAAAQ